MSYSYNSLCKELESLEKILENNKLDIYEKEEIQKRVNEIYYELARIDFI